MKHKRDSSDRAPGNGRESGVPQEGRSYRLGQRGRAMEETRARVVAAARELVLGENALAGFSMERVARQAGVTRVTVYHYFGSKRGLLEALFDDVGEKGRLRDRFPGIFSQADPLEALRLYIELFCDFWEGDRQLNRRLRGFAALDGEFAAAIASRYERRQFAIEKLLGRLISHKSIRLELSLSEAVRRIMALTGFELYDLLAGENQSPQEVAQLIFPLVLAAIGERKSKR